MSVSNLSNDLGSRYFSGAQPFIKASGVGAPNIAEPKPAEENASKAQVGVTVSISRDALAAYDASLTRMDNAMALTMNEGAQSGAGYELRNLRQNEAPGQATDATAGVEGDGDMDWDSVSMSLGAANGGQGIRTDDLTRVADLALADMQRKLDSAFALRNIPNTPPISLSFDAMGGLVIGEHPNQVRIEALFAENPELTNDLRTAHALKENATTWEKASLYTLAHEQTALEKGASAADALTELFLSIGDEDAELRYGSSGLDLSYKGATPKDYLASIAARLELRAAA
jgi:hypothetical protein